MKILAATRILNEEDIVEAFVRHHAAHLDGHILLDNGSNDRTVAILKALRNEAPDTLDLLAVRSVTFCEQLHNTLLYQRAASLGADWVCSRAADECPALRGTGQSLREALAAVPPDQEGVTVPLVNYYTTAQDDAADLLVPRRLRHRIRVPQGIRKLFLRATLPGAQVLNGNHGAVVAGRDVRAAALPGARLAHYHTRSGVQFLAKAVIGRIKVLAGGAEAHPESASGHYTRFLELLRDAPEQLLGNRDFIGGLNEGIELADDPIAYAGKPLAHTLPGDNTLRVIRAMAQAAESLARNHGRILDENRAVQTQIRLWNAEFRQIG